VASSSSAISSSSGGVSSSSISSSSLGSSSSSSGGMSSSSIAVSSSSISNSGTFTDDRDTQTYKWVRIGEQVWMAENLKYAASGSKCGNGSGKSLSNANTTTCDTYGRLYNWATAMNGYAGSDKNPSEVQGVCPSGWHLPSKAEWDALASYIENDKGCTSCGAKHLKTVSGWYSNNGLDSYEFSALPGSFGLDGILGDVDVHGWWWSASEYNGDNAYYRSMYYIYEYIQEGNCTKSYLYSVRCVQNN